MRQRGKHGFLHTGFPLALAAGRTAEKRVWWSAAKGPYLSQRMLPLPRVLAVSAKSQAAAVDQ